jgi:XTP/dITP diphosphohydrolase
MTSFVLATANPHKTAEIGAVLARLGIEVMPRPTDVPDVDETADTLEGNALLKAWALVRATGKPAVADDTGLFVDVLGGAPGVYSARYAGPGASDEQNVHQLLTNLETVKDVDRTAYFRTVIAVAYPEGRELCVEGVLVGTIARTPRGSGGFGYDGIFVPANGDGRTLGEYTPAEKNATSHRAIALLALAAEIAT